MLREADLEKKDPAEASLTTRLQIPGTIEKERRSGAVRSAAISQSDSAGSPSPCNPLFIGNSSFLLPPGSQHECLVAAPPPLMLLSHLPPLPTVAERDCWATIARWLLGHMEEMKKNLTEIFLAEDGN